MMRPLPLLVAALWSASMAAAAQHEATSAPATTGTLTGTVLLPDGRPAAGATVELRRYLLADTNALDSTAARTPRAVVTASCDAQGRFEVGIPEGHGHELRIAAERTAIEFRPRVYAGESLEVRLRPPAAIDGVLTRAADGSPIAGATVRVFAPMGHGDLASVATDAAGHFALTKLMPGPLTFAVQPRDLSFPDSAHLAVPEGRTLRHDVQLAEGETLRGTVLDAATGRPIHGATVSDEWSFARPVATDAGGRFELPGVRRDEIYARAPGYGQRCFACADGLDLRLEPGRTARGAIADAAGKALAGVYVAVVATEHVAGRQQLDWLVTQTAADGTFTVPGVRRDLPHCLFLRHDGHATLVYDFPADEAQRDEIDFGRIELPAATYLTGRVVDEDGRPLADVYVGLGGTPADRYRFAGGKAPEQPRGGFYVNHRSTYTDSLGRFHFPDLGTGQYRLRAHVEEVSPLLAGTRAVRSERVTVVAEPRVSTIRHELTLRLGRTLQGRVMTASGSPPPLVRIDTVPARELQDPNIEQVLIVRPGLPFRLFELPRGKVTLVATPYDIKGQPPDAAGPMAGERQWASAAPGTLWVCLPEPGWVQAFVVDAQGRPLAGARVSITTAGGHPELEQRTTDARGSVAAFAGSADALEFHVLRDAGAPVRSGRLAAGTANHVLVSR